MPIPSVSDRPNLNLEKFLKNKKEENQNLKNKIVIIMSQSLSFALKALDHPPPPLTYDFFFKIRRGCFFPRVFMLILG